MLLRPARRRGRGSASHLAPSDRCRAGETRLLPRTSSTTRETHLSATCRRRSRSPFFAPATRIPRLPMRFRLRRASRRSRWFAAARRVSPARQTDQGAKCAWKRHSVTFPAEGISRRRVADGRGVRASHRPRGSHAFRCVSWLRRASRRSRWFAAAGLSHRLDRPIGR